MDIIPVNVLSNDDCSDYSFESWWLGEGRLLVDGLLLGECCGQPCSHLLLPDILQPVNRAKADTRTHGSHDDRERSHDDRESHRRKYL